MAPQPERPLEVRRFPPVLSGSQTGHGTPLRVSMQGARQEAALGTFRFCRGTRTAGRFASSKLVSGEVRMAHARPGAFRLSLQGANGAAGRPRRAAPRPGQRRYRCMAQLPTPTCHEEPAEDVVCGPRWPRVSTAGRCPRGRVPPYCSARPALHIRVVSALVVVRARYFAIVTIRGFRCLHGRCRPGQRSAAVASSLRDEHARSSLLAPSVHRLRDPELPWLARRGELVVIRRLRPAFASTSTFDAT